MAISTPTTAATAGECRRLRGLRPGLLSAPQVGPVTVAIRAVRAEHGLRHRLEEGVDRLLALLDALDGDPDLEDGYDAELPAVEWQGRGVHYLAGGLA